MPAGNLENQLIAVAILVFGVLFEARLLLGKDIFNAVAGRLIFEIVKGIVILPFKIAKFVFDRLILMSR